MSDENRIPKMNLLEKTSFALGTVSIPGIVAYFVGGDNEVVREASNYALSVGPMAFGAGLFLYTLRNAQELMGR